MGVRILFAGTPEVALPSLRALADSAHSVAAVLTRPDAPAGRRRRPSPSPVAVLADELGFPVLKPVGPDAELVAQIRALDLDAAVVVAFGMLLPQPLLDAVPGGWLNLHFSLLPRWRGAAPVQRAILAGDQVTGATVFRIIKQLDAGPVFRSEPTPIGATETSGELLSRLAGSGVHLLLAALDDLAAGRKPHPQDATGIVLAAKLAPDEMRLDWAQPADNLLRTIRAASPEPGAWTTLAGRRFAILAARPDPQGPRLAGGELQADRRHLWVGTGSGTLELVRVQAFGKKAMLAADWARGHRWPAAQPLSFDA